MHDLIIEKQNFAGIRYTLNALKKAEYDNCMFKECDFSESDLSAVVFSECRFENCNLSLADLNGTAFKDNHFLNCKLVGARFSDCNDFLFEVTFDGCSLNLASFFKMDLSGMTFKNCTLQETDFVEANLHDAVFNNCDLHDAVFNRTNLQNADLRTAFNYKIDPASNTVQNALFSLTGVPGLLKKYNIRIE